MKLAIGEPVEQSVLWCFIGGNVKWYYQSAELFEVSYKDRIIIWSGNPNQYLSKKTNAYK